jgi:hypothetical protein
VAIQPNPVSVAASIDPLRDPSNERGEASARSNPRDPAEIEAGAQRYLARTEARRAAVRAEAIRSLQPGRYETWAMLVIVMASFALMFWVSAK